MSGAIPVARGCGTSRIAGGVYLEVGLSAGGLPLERFLCDPPLPIDLEALGLSYHGVKAIPQGDLWHVADGISLRDYPNPADFLEEVRRFGLSRRIPSTFDFGRITSRSLLLLFHARAYLSPPSPLYQTAPPAAPFQCPTGLHDPALLDDSVCCAGVWWETLIGGDAIPGSEDERRIQVRRPSFVYGGRTPPMGYLPRYQDAIFARFPITRIVVVRDDSGGRHQAILERIRRSGHDPVLLPE